MIKKLFENISIKNISRLKEKYFSNYVEVMIYIIKIKFCSSRFVLMIYAQNTITFFSRKSLMRIIKDEKNKDINSVLWNNRNNQLVS